MFGFRFKNCVRCKCGKAAIVKPTRIKILGEIYNFNSSISCRKCTKLYMEKFATKCSSCNDLILVDEKVQPSENGLLCRLCAKLTSKKWGEGTLLSLS